MPVAPNLSALKRRVDRYFWANRSSEMAILRRLLDTHFSAFERIAVVGGLVRDFAREGRSGFRSDVDLVIEAPADHVADLAKKLNAIPNRFGGYGFRSGIWRIDFWALETTWAVRHAGITAHYLEDVILCTFFDWDAIAYNLRTKQVICSQDYLKRIQQGALDINLCLTPSLEGNLLRSIRRLVLWNLNMGPVLQNFIEENLNDESFGVIKHKEKNEYSFQVTSAWRDADSARFSLLNSKNYLQFKEQFELSVFQ